MAKDWAIAMYAKLRDEMVAARGAGADGVSGILPRTKPEDCAGLMAGWLDEVVKAITHVASPEHAYAVDLDQAGSLMQQAGGLALAADAGLAKTVPIVQWLTIGRPTDDGQVRTMPPANTGGFWYEALAAAGVVINRGVTYRVSAGQAGPAAIVNMAARSDRCYQLIASFMRTPKPEWLSPEQTVEWWKSFYALMVATSVAQAIPTPGLWERVKGGIVYAAKGTAEEVKAGVTAGAHVAGEALAEGATIAGEALGQGVAGFAANAGLTAWLFVLAAVAIWIEVG